MLKVSKLPIPTTESDLRELFSHYKEIDIVSIEIEGDKSNAYVKLGNDEEESDAIEKLNKSKWRDNHRIYVDTFRGPKSHPDDPIKSGDESGKTENKDTENKSQ